jgi:hypothetical protein
MPCARVFDLSVRGINVSESESILENPYLTFVTKDMEITVVEGVTINNSMIGIAAARANEVWIELEKIPVGDGTFLDALDKKVVSGTVGEVFRVELAKISQDLLSNPRDDGSPDLCLLTTESRSFLESKGVDLNDLSKNAIKSVWTPFGGEEHRLPGIEIKATIIGKMVDQKRGPTYSNIKKPEWSAHHQQTPILLGLVWDYVNGLPSIVSAFFSNKLDTITGPDNRHWRKVTVPNQKKGSKATSSCGMYPLGRTEMYKNQLLIPKNRKIKLLLDIACGYITPLTKMLAPEVEQIAKELGLKLSRKGKKKQKAILIEEIIKLRAESIVGTTHTCQEERNILVGELLKDIGEEAAPTENPFLNEIILETWISKGVNHIDLELMKSYFKLDFDVTRLMNSLLNRLDQKLSDQE